MPLEAPSGKTFCYVPRSKSDDCSKKRDCCLRLLSLVTYDRLIGDHLLHPEGNNKDNGRRLRRKPSCLCEKPTSCDQTLCIENSSSKDSTGELSSQKEYRKFATKSYGILKNYVQKRDACYEKCRLLPLCL